MTVRGANTLKQPSDWRRKEMYNKLPNELKENALFCLWKYETRDGKKTKVPYQTNGKRADKTNPACYTNFETAIKHLANYDGIGMGIFKPFVAIDIDHCVADGKLSDMAMEIVKIINSYTEYSPSGKGICIIAKVDDLDYNKSLYYINNRKIHLEVYVYDITTAFVTLTGNAIHKVDVANRTDEVMDILNKYIQKAKVTKNVHTDIGSYLSDESVIKKQ